MPGSSKSREELVGFLDRKVFDPILHTKEDQFAGEQRKKFESLRQSTES